MGGCFFLEGKGEAHVWPSKHQQSDLLFVSWFSYKWRRNEIDFNAAGNDDRVVQLSNKGTLVINRPEDKDEGLFQCFATNDFGTSATG